MKHRQVYWTRASFGLLLFVFIGYVVKFYPQQLVAFDTALQVAIRGDLPDILTALYRGITMIGNPEVQAVTVPLLGVVFVLKKWKSEAIWLAVNGILAGVLILALKPIYARPRPSIQHLVEAGGVSFPSGHSLGAMLIIGTLIIIVYQRLREGMTRQLVLLSLGLLITLIGLSRIYLGVHYPSDVLSGFLLGYSVLNIGFPIYDQKRFEWRFQSKQK